MYEFANKHRYGTVKKRQKQRAIEARKAEKAAEKATAVAQVAKKTPTAEDEEKDLNPNVREREELQNTVHVDPDNTSSNILKFAAGR